MAETSTPQVIMVVDDSQTVRNLMALILHRLGYGSVRVRGALEALNVLREFVPALIFLDITLPGMDGLDVCKIIKEHRYLQRVPVAMLSGSNQVFDRVMGRLAGAEEYITKPFDPETIRQCVEKYCESGLYVREGLWQKHRR